MAFKLLTLISLILFGSVAYADEYRNEVNEGYDYYKNGEYDKAAERYRQASILKPDKMLPKIGKGAALYKSKDYEGAGKEFSTAVDKGDKKAAADMYYNIGNTRYKAQDYQGAVKSYIDALKINPNDKDYKHNLETALYQLKQQQKQNNNDNQDNKDKKDQDQKQQNGQQGDNKKDQQKKEPDKQQQQPDQRDKQDKQQQMQQQQMTGEDKMSQEEAKKLLARFSEDEKEIQKKLKQVNIRRGSSRDW